MIKHIKSFKFPKLENLDIGINNLQNLEFFESIEHFKELKQLNVSSNIFNREIPKNWNIKEIKLDSLEKIDFSNGIFSDKTINFMFSIFKFKNLVFINLMSNNIKELHFIEKLQNSPLEILILTNNEIDETQLKYLQNFPKLKEINLKNNLIKNINEVNNLANQLKNIEKIIVCGNQIDLYTNKLKMEIEKSKGLSDLYSIIEKSEANSGIKVTYTSVIAELDFFDERTIDWDIFKRVYSNYLDKYLSTILLYMRWDFIKSQVDIPFRFNRDMIINSPLGKLLMKGGNPTWIG